MQVCRTNAGGSWVKGLKATSSKGRLKPKAQAAVVDKDVEILSSMIQRSGLTDEEIAARVGDARKSKMSPITVRAIRELSCKRPHNYTIEWIGFALGMKRMWVSIH